MELCGYVNLSALSIEQKREDLLQYKYCMFVTVLYDWRVLSDSVDIMMYFYHLSLWHCQDTFVLGDEWSQSGV